MNNAKSVNTKALLACALLLVLVAGALLLAQAQKTPPSPAGEHVSTVPYWEIGNRVQILGTLGQPIGTYLRLEGKRVGQAKVPTKTGPGDFRVEKVNGKPLAQPLTLWSEPVKAWPMGTRGVVEGYETGEMIGVPEEVLARTGRPAPQAVWQFSVHFISLAAKPARR